MTGVQGCGVGSARGGAEGEFWMACSFGSLGGSRGLTGGGGGGRGGGTFEYTGGKDQSDKCVCVCMCVSSSKCGVLGGDAVRRIRTEHSTAEARVDDDGLPPPRTVVPPGTVAYGSS